MQTYLVGGAVRDRLLGRPVKERDYVVVGATPEEMVAQGFRPVGKDFPVFLHPETKEEYALARTERKTAPGYHGFVFHAAPDVTLEEDLRRRDLTVNAMAEAADGSLIDYFGGRADLEARLLRHVSPAFAEDPVRILRTARFAARYAPLGFRVANDTRQLMQQMVTAGEVDALVPERVWQELARALAEDAPQVFFQVLRDCGALARLFPAVDALFGVPQNPDMHPEIDTGVHTLMVLEQCARLTSDPAIRFAALTHDLGKGSTPRDQWPSHKGHEARSVQLVEDLCDRYRAPREYRDLAVITAEWHGHVHRAEEIGAGEIVQVLERTDAFRRPGRFEKFLTACHADSLGRTGFEDSPYPQAERMRRALEAARTVEPAPLVAQGLRGEVLGEAIHAARIRAVEGLGEG
ncbi:MAG TPA: multifunctional CCA addition/repair protein [Thioalkalivibrio sp.]|mgnify:FL=1|nr:multifunctional CCA addition/repair protein [Thioalkalivibrio sp.]